MARDDIGGVLPLRAAMRPVGLGAVHELLELDRRRRVTVVIAAAGWGKTTSVASWVSRTRSAWLHHRGDGPQTASRFVQRLVETLDAHLDGLSAPAIRFARQSDVELAVVALCDWLQMALHEDLVLVVDDLQELDSDAAGVVEALCRHCPRRLHVVLLSRQELPFSLERLRGEGLITEISARELALDVADIAALLSKAIGDAPPALAIQVWERTSGWPVAVSAVLDALRGVDPDRRSGVVEQLVRPGERFHGYLTEEVIGAEAAPVRELLPRLAVFGEARSTSGIAPGTDGVQRLLADLTRRGLVRRESGDSTRWSLIQPLQDYFDLETALSADDRSALHHTAAQECLVHEAPGEALRHLVAAGDPAACAALLLDHGAGLVNSGHVGAVLEAAQVFAEHLEDPRIQQVIGQARQVRGQWAAAMVCFRRAGHDREELEPALAWRVAQLAFMQGDLPEVRLLYDRTLFGREDTADETQMLALAATACRMVGDVVGGQGVTARAVAAARRCGEPRAWAVVHNLLATNAAAEGDRRRCDGHFASALDSAEAGAHLLQISSIRVARATLLLEQGLPRPAVAEAQAALRYTERCENPFLTAHALTTRGRANARLGSFEPALADLTTAIDLFARLSSRFLAWPLCGLGDLHRTRGHVARARAAYEEALALIEPCHDVLGLGSALLGLARVRAADDITAARALADRAVALHEGLRVVPAFLTRGWVALMADDRQAAAADAARAGAAARQRRDSPGLAEAIMLSVLAGPGPATDAGMLSETIEVWRDAGCRVEEAAAHLVAARLGARIKGTDPELAQETLRECGIEVTGRRPAGPLAVVQRSAPLVSIRTLGIFQVMHDGQPVPKAAWQSRKARDLLKLLVARRRPVPREELMDLLWPDQVDSSRSANRLSVLLSMVRDVLPSARSVDGPVVSVGDAVWLDHAQVAVDVDDFLGRAGAALDAHRRNEADATIRLAAAEAGYTGGFLEDDPYQEWAQPLAEEVRATHMALLRALTARLRAAGDVDGVARYTLRILGQDGYDEEAHLVLVAVLAEAGRLGEARRRYRVYVRRMKEMRVEPRSMPRVRRGAKPGSTTKSS